MTVTYRKQIMWECTCGANGYEDTIKEARETVCWHKQNCDKDRPDPRDLDMIEAEELK